VKQKYIPGVKRAVTILPPTTTKIKKSADDVYGYTSEEDDDSSDEESSDDSDSDVSPDEELSQLFEESDSDDAGSFEVFYKLFSNLIFMHKV